jgi:hypothetical protein
MLIPVVLLFTFGHWLLGAVLFFGSAFGLLSIPWRVIVTATDILVQGPFRRARYPLSTIRDVAFIGTTAPGFRLEFVDGTSLVIKGFGIERIDDLYKASLSALHGTPVEPPKI